MKRALFIGRFQPFHKGHEWLINQKLSQNIPILIFVRDAPINEHNPFDAVHVVKMIKIRYAGLEEGIVAVEAIPDIESINYGRGVGYEINEFEPPNDIGNISATEIRNCLKSGDDSWQDRIDCTLWKHVKKVLSK